MTKPTEETLLPNKPLDEDPIGEGAQEIRRVKQALIDVYPIGPDDLDYEKTENWWPAGSMTGGVDPDVASGAALPHDAMQDRYALLADQVANYDWDVPENKNILTIGMENNAHINVPDSSNWVNIETDDHVQAKALNDLNDVYIGSVEPLDKDILVYNDSFNQWINRPIQELVTKGDDGVDGKGWTGTTILQNDDTTYIVRFDSTYPELVFDTDNLRGPAGSDGTSAYQQWLDAGNSGTEQDFLDSLQGANGANGADGDSAYQIAVDNGFLGTEEEWLESLVGDEGPAGADGHGLNFQGEVADEASLPGTANEGDAYKTTDTGHIWVYTENGDWLDLGNVEGTPGADGASAYEIAVANGFVGDEAAWLESLVGDEGVTPTIVAGTATKLDHQAAPTVTLSVLGNDTYQYDFGIPAGEPADPLDLEPLENAVADLQTDLNSLEGRVGQNETDISDIQAEQITQNDSIQANQDKNDEQDLRLDGLDTSVSDNALAIEVNANAIADIQNIQGGANTVPDPVKADDVLMSDGPDAYSWRTIDFAAIDDVRDKVYDHENQIHGNPDTLPDPTVGLIDRVTDLENAVEQIEGLDPADHVSQEQLNEALWGESQGGTINDPADGVYAAIKANTDEIESNNADILDLQGRVGQNETDIANLQTSTGDNATAIGENATAIGILEGRVDGHDTDIAQNTGDIQQNQTDISTNAGNIAQNTIDIGLLDGRVTVNEGDISTNTTDISAIKAQLTPGSHETILTSVDNGDGTYSTTWAPNEHIDDELPDTSTANEGDILALVDNAGELEPAWIVQPEAMDLGNTVPWTHGQYNELFVTDGAATLDLHVTPMVHVLPTSGSTVTMTASVPQRPDPDNVGSFLPIHGMTANIVLDMNSTYDFSDPIWNIGTQTYTDLDNDMILSFLSEDSKWHCVGMSYVGADAVVEAGSSGIEEAPEDGNTYVRKDGQWVSGGKVLQVVQAVKTDSFSNTTATLVQIPGLSADITPKSTSSKILVMYSVGMGNNDATGGMKLQLYRDGTEIYLGTTATSENLSSYGGVAGNVDNITNFAGIYLDLPSSTSAVTYSLSAARHTRGSVTINQRGSGLSNVTPSSITLMEIAG